MSATLEKNDSNNLTTDAFPSPPRSPRDSFDDLLNETPKEEESTGRNSRKHSSSSSSSTHRCKKDSESEDSDNSCSRKTSSSSGRRYSGKSCNGIPQSNGAFPSVINISNASGVQIGSNFTYIVKYPKDKQRNPKKTKQFPKTDKVNLLMNSEEVVKEDDLQFISLHIDEKWMETARYLDYSNGQISQFHCDYIDNGLKEVIYQFLLDWIRNNGQEATVGKLTDALWNTDQRECVTKWSEK